MTNTLSDGEIQRQREITRLCIKTALLLLQHGAESTLVVQMATRLGLALGVDSVECVLITNGVMLTTLYKDNCVTTVRRNQDKGINMHVITEVSHIVITAEHKIFDIYQVRQNLERVKAKKYNRYLVMFMVGLSCACFSHLAGGDWAIFGITFVASSIAMFIRQELVKYHYNHIIVFAITAFVGSIISGLALKYQIGNIPEIALASSVLLLVPGFPLINALADILKGYINMGIGRWALATVLTFGACIGIVFALNVLQIHGWGGN